MARVILDENDVTFVSDWIERFDREDFLSEYKSFIAPDQWALLKENLRETVKGLLESCLIMRAVEEAITARPWGPELLFNYQSPDGEAFQREADRQNMWYEILKPAKPQGMLDNPAAAAIHEMLWQAQKLVLKGEGASV